jgi:glutaconate CoA-transferase subunit B
LCDRLLVITRLAKRGFPERVDFITSPGYLDGGNARERLKLRGGGPQAVITDHCIFRFDPETKEMILASVHPGASVEQVRAMVGWDLGVAESLKTTEPPSDEELRLIREDLDPQGMYSR